MTNDYPPTFIRLIRPRPRPKRKRLPVTWWLLRADENPKPPMILKHGPRGADFMLDGMRHFASAIPAVDTVDGTGAGEILAGVCLALRTCGLPEDQALDGAGGDDFRNGVWGGWASSDPRTDLIRNTVSKEGMPGAREPDCPAAKHLAVERGAQRSAGHLRAGRSGRRGPAHRRRPNRRSLSRLMPTELALPVAGRGGCVSRGGVPFPVTCPGRPRRPSGRGRCDLERPATARRSTPSVLV
jgi:hypothetical protein